jgi:hypothetical protein
MNDLKLLKNDDDDKDVHTSRMNDAFEFHDLEVDLISPVDQVHYTV